MKRLTQILTASMVLIGSSAWACSVPVFRYAIENWEPDRLTVVILHDGQLSAGSKELVGRIEAAAYEADEEVNLRLHPIDISVDHPEGSPEAQHRAAWKDKSLPQMLVYFSNNSAKPQLAWSAAFSSANVDQLLHSPARQTIVSRLLDGQSAVWVLLKTGNRAADERAEKTLREELAKKPSEIELPSLTDLASEEKFDESLNVEMRVEFSLVTLEADDPQEACFRQMLLNTEADLKDFDEPIAIPIYGRGRTYFALVGPGITADNIADNCNFICGACSCEVKRDNPGQDLLLAANWNQVEPGNWVNDTPLPALTGIGGFEALADETITDRPEADRAAVDERLVASFKETPAELPTEATEPPSSAAESATQPANVNIREVDLTLPLMIFSGWALALLCVGVIFTLWNRRRTTD